jgi:hypothetical protein
VITSGSFLTIVEAAVSTSAEADPNERFAIDLNGTSASELSIAMTPRGFITKATSESTDAIIPAVTGIVDIGASIAAKVAFGAPDAEDEKDKKCNDAEVALIAARAQLRDVFGAPGFSDDKEVIELKAARITSLISRLEEPFTGVKPGKPLKVICEVRPGSAGDTELFKWTIHSGVQDGHGLCDVPGELKAFTNPSQGPPEIRVRHIVVLRVAQEDCSLCADERTPKDAERGFFYRVPAFGSVEVVDKTDTSTKTISDRVKAALPQLGEVRSLPRVSGSKSARVSISLDPETGALIEAGIKTAGIDFASASGSLQKSIGTVLDAREAGKQDELEKLQRQQAILEARVAIKTAKTALGEE